MKILLHCDEYDPRHVPIAIRMSVFSQLFRQKGHEVQVLTGAQFGRWLAACAGGNLLPADSIGKEKHCHADAQSVELRGDLFPEKLWHGGI